MHKEDYREIPHHEVSRSPVPAKSQETARYATAVNDAAGMRSSRWTREGVERLVSSG